VNVNEFDFIIIGTGPAGEAAAYEARRRNASVAIVDRLWFGGSCPHIGCIPSKSLLDSAARHEANAAMWSWRETSERRDWMVNRPLDAEEPDDSSHKKALEDAGAVAYRGEARISERGHVEVRHDDAVHVVHGRNVVVAVGSRSKVPPVPGLDAVPYWTNRQATLTRELPKSLLVLGGGPTGCELAQVYARFGVPVTIVQSGDRLAPTDHPRNSQVIAEALRDDGVQVRLGVRAVAARAGAGADGAHVIDLDDGRLAKAKEFGADVTINNSREDAVKRVFELTGGFGADVAVEAVGLPSTFELAAELIRAGGKLANVGVHGKAATLHLEKLWIKDVTITTGLVDTRTIPQLLSLIEGGRLDPTVLATHHFPMDEAMEAYEVFGNAAKSHALKVVLQGTAVVNKTNPKVAVTTSA